MTSVVYNVASFASQNHHWHKHGHGRRNHSSTNSGQNFRWFIRIALGRHDYTNKMLFFFFLKIIVHRIGWLIRSKFCLKFRSPVGRVEDCACLFVGDWFWLGAGVCVCCVNSKLNFVKPKCFSKIVRCTVYFPVLQLPFITLRRLTIFFCGLIVCFGPPVRVCAVALTCSSIVWSVASTSNSPPCDVNNVGGLSMSVEKVLVLFWSCSDPIAGKTVSLTVLCATTCGTLSVTADCDSDIARLPCCRCPPGIW